jgi:hypothetical protein
MMAGFFTHVSVAILVLFAYGQSAQAQGSMGGSIGVQEKSVSGDRDAPKGAPVPPKRTAPKAAAKPQRPAPEPKAAPRKGGGGGNYDGTWHVTQVGCGAFNGAFFISGSRVSASRAGFSGSISSGGSLRAGSQTSVVRAVHVLTEA